VFKLSTKIRYGTRAIIRIAAEGKKGAVSLNDVSHAEDISLKYLENIVSALKKNGLVNSIKGPKGGYVLSKPLREVTLLDIARALEGEVALVDCCGEGFDCERKEFCPTYDTWYELSHMMKKTMSSIKLNSLVKKDEKKIKKKKK
jgi:Rrf2 family protein